VQWCSPPLVPDVRYVLNLLEFYKFCYYRKFIYHLSLVLFVLPISFYLQDFIFIFGPSRFMFLEGKRFSSDTTSRPSHLMGTGDFPWSWSQNILNWPLFSIFCPGYKCVWNCTSTPQMSSWFGAHHLLFTFEL
jgi:hypothetical protein